MLFKYFPFSHSSFPATRVGNDGHSGGLSRQALLATAVLAAIFTGAATVSATNYTWLGNGGNGNWSTTANWDTNGVPPNPNAGLIVMQGANNLNSNVDVGTAPYGINQLEFYTGAGAFTLSGYALQTDATSSYIKNLATNIQTINNAIEVATGDQLFLQPNGGNLILGGGVTGAGNTSSIDVQGNAAQNVTLNGVVSGTFSNIKVDSGATVFFNAANTFTGNMTVYAGTFELGNSSALGAVGNYIQLNNGTGTSTTSLLTSAAVTIAQNITIANATSDATGNNTIGGVSVDASTFTGKISLGSTDTQPLNLTAVANGTVTFSGNLVHAGTGTTDSVTKVGAGLVILSGTGNNYTGTTTVQTGNLQINGKLTGTGAVTVDSGATLSGVGTIAGAVTVNGGGILSPGDAPGTFTLSGGLTLANNSVLDFTLGSPNVAGGTGGNDLVSTAALTLGTGLTVHITQGTGYGTGLYHLIDYSGALTNNSSNFTGWTVTGLAAGQTAVFSLGTDGTSNAVNMTISSTSIPEPATLGLLAIGSLGILAGRRRRSA